MKCALPVRCGRSHLKRASEATQWSIEKVEESCLWRCLDASTGLGRAAIISLVRSWKCRAAIINLVRSWKCTLGCSRQFIWPINVPGREYVRRVLRACKVEKFTKSESLGKKNYWKIVQI